ncbi:MAG: hypothetical protein M1825_002105 [Sarcosagium campestre]|nr:MAG: hypothetical protein M1825_002105 [Sarcosagium campestre]
MAAARPTRKSSRMSSPFVRNGPEASVLPAVVQEKPQEKKFAWNEWIEPPLRPPAPSFEDYKGIERQGVLSQMAPLGTLPPVKAKAKQKVTKRLAQVKNGVVEVLPPDTPALTPMERVRRSSSRKIEDALVQSPQSRNNTSESIKLVEPAELLQAALQPSITVPAPNSKTSQGRAKIRAIVDDAVAKAVKAGREDLAAALTQFYEESKVNRDLAEILDAVLAQNTTEKQWKEFSTYLKDQRHWRWIERSDEVTTAPATAEKQASMSTRQSSAAETQPSPRVTAKPTPKSTPKSQPKSQRLGTRGKPTEAADPVAGQPRTTQNSASPRKSAKRKRDAAATPTVVPRVNGMTTRSIAMSRSGSGESNTSTLSSLNSSLENHTFIATSKAANTAPSYNSRSVTLASEKAAPAKPMLDALSTGADGSVIVNQAASKRSSTVAGFDQDDDDADTSVEVKRQRLKITFSDVKIRQSNVRTSPEDRQSVLGQHGTSDPGAPSAPSTVQPPRLRNGTLKKLAADEERRAASPTPSLHEETPLSAAAVNGDRTRFGTPTVQGRSGPKKAKKTPRVKTSPVKPKSGVIAGIARGGGRNETRGNHENDMGDNADECSACGGEGDLLCCDGCDRSFHFTCLDPPMDPENLPETWFCFVCAARKGVPRRPRGLFAELLGGLEKQNPVAFNLPAEVRDYFEGVQTGKNGEYKVAVPPKAKTRGSQEDAADLLKIKDSKGNWVLCFRCGLTALNKKPIITCDYCPSHWHLDCLNPPKANPPTLLPNGTRRTWMCPNHVEHELREIKALSGGHAGQKAHKIRKPRQFTVVDSALRRGQKNNGNIEIENDPSDVEAEEFYDEEEASVVYRLPERGIKLDFIEAVKRSRAQRLAAAKRAEYKRNRGRKSFVEDKAALNLAQFANANADIALDADATKNLVDTLIAEAPADVVALYAESAPASEPTSLSVTPAPQASRVALQGQGSQTDERQSLLMLQELIRRRLEGFEAEI